MISHLGSDPSLLLCFWKARLISKAVQKAAVTVTALAEHAWDFCFIWTREGAELLPPSLVSFSCCDCAVFICFYHSGHLTAFIHAWMKMTRSSDLNSSHRPPAPPFLDPVELSGNLKEVMRISAHGRETAVRCPGSFCSDQCSLIFCVGPGCAF